MRKKLFVVFFIILIILFISKNNNNKNNTINSEEIRGIYISYIEFMNHFNNKNSNEIKHEIDLMIKNINENKFNMILLHVRPFSDSIYQSNIFPYSHTVPLKNNINKLDILDYFIKEGHEFNIKIHAWINPYRISNIDDVSKISYKNPCYKWIGTNKVKLIKNKGIYYNPASQEVEDLIVNGVDEILNNYDVDGIHFDDYFYASNDIDNDNYKEYIKNGGTLSLNKYRYNNVNKLIKRVYSLIKKYDNKIIFSIAPDANIENNYKINYADVLTWLSENNYIDYIIPQLYYGFSNSNKPYINTLLEWNNNIKNESKIIPALAFYKIGLEDKYAGEGKLEWINNNKIISNQIKVARNFDKYSGFVIFRYDYFFKNKDINIKEKEEVLKIIDLNK